MLFGMRKEIYRMPREEALRFLARAPCVSLASVGAAGQPVFRVLHGVIVGDYLAFHGAPAGEKLEVLGKQAVISAEEIIAEIPSYWIDPVRACPATTYYRSVQLRGVVEQVEDLSWKARALTKLMERFQPEGGHAPIDPEDPLYRGPVSGILIARVSLAELDGKSKLGQNRKPEELAKILERLWQRGAKGDLRAIELVRRANRELPVPEFLRGPEGSSFTVAPSEADLEPVLGLLEGEYWNRDLPRAVIARSHLESSAWIVARDAADGVIATARAIGDGARRGWIFDVAVERSWRGRGLGMALLKLLLDHPAVRSLRQIRLGTRDAQGFYRRLGFSDLASRPPRYPEMILERFIQANVREASAISRESPLSAP
jgi:ribosomal protein S18 acetylase RimI-like enzyme/nitroimidazol reductase NimA-like FMN-containing flavoprotein (pyridoxamine 5'-phosphate oxidase superfamily)